MTNYERLTEQLIRDEGLVLHAYYDSEGYLTIGAGRLIDPRKGGGITREEALQLLHNDLVKHTKAVIERLPWAVVEKIGAPRFYALVNMHFQLGDNLFKFVKTLTFMRNGKWHEASHEMLDSKWAQQTPNRAKRLSEQVYKNEWV